MSEGYESAVDEDSEIERQIKAQHFAEGESGNGGLEQTVASIGDEDSRCAASEAEDEIFGHQLPQDTGATRAEGEPNGYFAC